MLKRLRVLALLAASMLVACASVDAKKIAKFGEATTAVAQIVADVPEVADKVAAQAEFEDQAMAFESRARATSFPPNVPTSDLKFRKVWAVRTDLLNAIAGYGAALAAAASGKNGESLETALGSLKKALNTVPALAANTRFQGAASIAEGAATKLFLHVSDARLRQYISEAHPLIVQSAALLSDSFAQTSGYIDADYQNWLNDKETMLDDVRRDAKGSNADRYAIYAQFSRDSQAMEETLALFRPRKAPRYEELLSQMVAAHAALRRPNADPAIVEEFVASVKEIAQALKQLTGK
ncbi:hypothetical protein [Rhizobium sp. Rhizsp42]|uniref:hypothetical protein n=1 Tax=Rhizobium sp. Rhizsp42 TaxID=3243034 RepID=UPI0039AF94D8